MLQLDLADKSIRAYKKRSGKISLHLRSYLLVKTNASFSLSYYMKSIDCLLILEDGTEIPFDNTSFSVHTICEDAFQVMAHNFQASTVTGFSDIKRCLARLRVSYHISFTGYPYEKPDHFEKVVSVVKRY
jgi:hypothetical protein